MTKIKNFFGSIDWKNVKPHTYVSMVMTIIAIANYALTAMGRPIIRLSNEDITFAVNVAMSIVFTVYPMWKNNSYTELAQLSDKTLYALRDGKISKDELEQFISEYSHSMESK